MKDGLYHNKGETDNDFNEPRIILQFIIWMLVRDHVLQVRGNLLPEIYTPLHMRFVMEILHIHT